MRIVSLEEHVVLPDMTAQLLRSAGNASSTSAATSLDRALADLGEGRIRDMDAAGITLQVLSIVGRGAETLDGSEAIAFAKAYNERLAEPTRTFPERFAAFAHLPMRVPEAAADELERCVTQLGILRSTHQWNDGRPVSLLPRV